MGKTTNILDLNNRLEKVEKGNVPQNNYNSLKNRPKINGNLLTGDKTGAQLGLAEAQDIGDLSALTTTDKSSAVAAINEVNGGLADKYYSNSVTGAPNITIHTSTMIVTGSVVSLFLVFESSSAINGLKQIGSINNNIVPSTIGIGVMTGISVESLGTIVVKNNTDVLVNANLAANTRYTVSVVFVK